MEGFPWDDLRKILPGSCQVTSVLQGAETLPKISIGWVGCMNVTDDRRQTDRQTNRQTDGRRHIANMKMSSRSLIIASWHFIQAWLSILVAVIVEPPAETHNYTGRRLPMTAFEEIVLNETHGELYVCTFVSLYIIWNV